MATFQLFLGDTFRRSVASSAGTASASFAGTAIRHAVLSSSGFSDTQFESGAIAIADGFNDSSFVAEAIAETAGSLDGGSAATFESGSILLSESESIASFVGDATAYAAFDASGTALTATMSGSITAINGSGSVSFTGHAIHHTATSIDTKAEVSFSALSFDFSNAKLNRLIPLANSYAENEIEADLKKLFIDLFKDHLAKDAFDANVLGSAHLGSLDLVRKSVNTDGLVLLQGDLEEAATRYLYRAWKSGDVQGRGLHFLRTYLQMLIPNGAEVDQLWHDKNYPYPTALYTLKPSPAWWIHQLGEEGLKLDGSWGLGRPIPGAEETRKNRTTTTEGKYLTSRVLISMDMTNSDQSVSSLIHIIRSVIPARLVPIFNLWLRITFNTSLSVYSSLSMEKTVNFRHPWCGRVITDREEAKWKLGKDGEPAKLPAPFGSFKVGKLYGKNAPVQLGSCRIVSNLNISMLAEMPSWRVETLPPDPDPEYLYPDPTMTLTAQYLNIDGSWTLDGRKIATYPKLSELKIISIKNQFFCRRNQPG